MAADEVQGKKEALALAVLRLLATRGMDAVSYGSVAVEAGVSKGLVQHYFPERTQLFDHASQVLARRMAARFEAALTGRKDRTDTASGPDLFRVLVGMLPTDDDARLDAAAGRALFALALSDADANARYRQGRRAALGLIQTLIAQRRPGGPSAFDERVARDLLGTVAQLGEDLLLGELTQRKARTLLRQRLEALDAG